MTHILPMIKSALEKAFRSVQDGGLGLFRECLWSTSKVAKLNKNTLHVDNLLSNAFGTGYFDLLLYHYPLMKIFDTVNDAKILGG
jgi:diketogulonate reductase-like aldo/keto reductase